MRGTKKLTYVIWITMTDFNLRLYYLIWIAHYNESWKHGMVDFKLSNIDFSTKFKNFSWLCLTEKQELRKTCPVNKFKRPQIITDHAPFPTCSRIKFWQFSISLQHFVDIHFHDVDDLIEVKRQIRQAFNSSFDGITTLENDRG